MSPSHSDSALTRFRWSWIATNGVMWIVALLIGGPFLFLALIALVGGLGSPGTLSISDIIILSSVLLVGAGIFGAILGFFQALLLRDKGTQSTAWIVASAGGFVVSFAIVCLISALVGQIVALLQLSTMSRFVEDGLALLMGVFIFAIAGAVFGWMQSRAIRETLPPNQWIRASSLGWSIAWLAAGIAQLTYTPLFALIGIASVGIIYGGITGQALFLALKTQNQR